MKEKFVKAEMEIIEFEMEDVITASLIIEDEDELPLLPGN